MKAFIGGAFRFAGFCGLSFLIGLAAVPSGNAQTPAPIFKRIDLLTNRDISLTVTGKTGLPHRLEFSTNLVEWQNWTTFVVPPSGSLQQTDTAAAFLPGRYFRLSQRAETNLLTGDHIQTGDGDLVIHPVNHASFVMQWKDLVIYNDPVGGAAPYKGLPRPDLILVSHDHGDHFDSNTLIAVRKTNTVIIAPRAVYNGLSTALQSVTTVLTNGASTIALGLNINAVPAYNNSNTPHPKGVGNGYVVSIGGKSLYMTGDTGNIPEMRSLTNIANIDVAFVCMNVPFTMTITDSVAAVQAFRPRIVYPYHFRNGDNSLTDLNSFKRLLGQNIQCEVRLRKWY